MSGYGSDNQIRSAICVPKLHQQLRPTLRPNCRPNLSPKFWGTNIVQITFILWATPTAAGPSGDRSFGKLVKEVGQQTCRSADRTQCAQINDRALALQTRSSMRAAVEVIIHASRLVREKRELSCNQSLFSCSVRR